MVILSATSALAPRNLAPLLSCVVDQITSPSLLTSRTVARALLAKRGLRAEMAHNGREAVRMASTNRYAAILMDCQMPELDGYEATRRIRAAEHGRHVPIIAMTAHSMKGDRERCLAAGMDDYLSKPVRHDQLDEAVKRWLSAA